VSDTKEFQGKNLDEAIEAACKHYDQKRDKLEIEIVSGGSSGIFGLVGVKKAVVRAKPRGSFKAAPEAAPEAAPKRAERQDREERSRRDPAPVQAAPIQAEPVQAAAIQSAPIQAAQNAASGRAAQPNAESASVAAAPAAVTAEGEQGEAPRRSERSRSRRGRGRGERSGEKTADKPAEKTAEKSAARPGDPQPARRRERPRREADPRAPRRDQQAVPASARMGDDEDNAAPQGIGHLDQALLAEVAREVTQKLLLPLVENATVAVELLPDRVCVRIEDPENSGLLIGREGQTLASIQYLVNRLVSKRMDASVRVQIDAGDYRENQDERLRQIARHLADKATNTGRTQSTRPMSSYHRRVVHLTLQDDEFVFTRSKGEGSMKRVLIMPKRKGKNGEYTEDAPEGNCECTPEVTENAGE